MRIQHARTDLAAHVRAPSPRVAGLAVVAIALSTALVALLEEATGIIDASAVYVVAVVVVGWLGGTTVAIGTAVVAFLVYDLLFTDPRFSLVVSDTNELLNLVLVLIVAVAVGRLAALGRARAAEADRRAAEASSLFAISRLLATADRTDSVADAIVERLARDADLSRVWIELEPGGAPRTLADSGAGPLPARSMVVSLVRTPGDEPARWIRTHEAGPTADGGQGRGATPAVRQPADGQVFRIRIETEGTVYGSLWFVRPRPAGLPGPEATRVSSLAADQIALSLRRDRLRGEAMSAEVARRSDALKSALLDSVSHDMRTPLASIRATAGNLADPDVALSPADIRSAADSIDLEAQRLDRFVRSVLDLSRIESGVLVPDLEIVDLPELIGRTVARLEPTVAPHPVTVAHEADLPPARVDAVFMDAIVANLLDNVVDHTPADTPIAIRTTRDGTGRITLTVEDGGPGVAPTDLPFVFDKFRRSTGSGQGSRRGMGIGLSIVRGLSEAMGGTARARPSELGGLAIDIDLEAAPEPPSETGTR